MRMSSKMRLSNSSSERERSRGLVRRGSGLSALWRQFFPIWRELEGFGMFDCSFFICSLMGYLLSSSPEINVFQTRRRVFGEFAQCYP